MRAHDGELEPVSASLIRTHVCLSLPPIFIKWVVCGKARLQVRRKSCCLSSWRCAHIWLRAWGGWGGPVDQEELQIWVLACASQTAQSSVTVNELPQCQGLCTDPQRALDTDCLLSAFQLLYGFLQRPALTQNPTEKEILGSIISGSRG